MEFYGIIAERPVHNNYAVESIRRISYKNWPEGIEQTPEQLAAAGFFYLGNIDNLGRNLHFIIYFNMFVQIGNILII